MEIAIIYDAVYPYVKGGGEKRIYELAERLKKNHNVHLFGMKFWNGKDVIVKDDIYFHGVCRPKNLYNESGQRSIFEPIYFSYHLFRALIKEKKDFDVIDCQNFPYFPCFSCRLYSILRKRPLIITWLEVWDDYWYRHLGILGLFGKYVESLTARLTENNVAISGYTEKRLRKINKKIRVTTIPVGVDSDKIRKTRPSKERFDILFVGRLIKEKNVDVLIKAIKLIDKKNLKAGIIGDGPEKQSLIRLAKSMELEKNIRFLGFVPDVYPYMKSARLFVLPSTREGFGTVALEALACGTPVITIRHKDNAAMDLVSKEFICELDERKLADKIKDVLSAKKCKKTGITVDKRHNWDEIVKDVERYYGTFDNGAEK